MSIATRKGDDGTTGLMYNRRVAKNHPQVEAYAAVDELNTALGMARALVTDASISQSILTVQKQLVQLMGELAVAPGDMERYLKDGFDLLPPDAVQHLDAWVAETEASNVSFKGWATPGACVPSAAIEVARTTCRRAERRICDLRSQESSPRPEIIAYLNRLADALWLSARWVETHAGDAHSDTA
jgi:cob(I)alamin adenosyltransferase